MSVKARVIIVGAGFGGLDAARRLSGEPYDVLIVDRQNFHTFTPLLYQVATCGLDPSEIAYPVRSIFYDAPNVNFLLGEVNAIDAQQQEIVVQVDGHEQRECYDYLIVAAGSVTNFFGNDAIAHHAFQLKSLTDAVMLRNHILHLFEQAAWTEDAAHKTALMTFVVVGGGPTGLETAGALYELYNYVLHKEYQHGQGLKARVVLVEASDTLLGPFPQKLRLAALQQIEAMGVEVVLGSAVAHVDAASIMLQDGQVIATHTVVWAAGVQAASLAHKMAVELARGGRVPVERTLTLDGHSNIYVIGDMAYLEDEQGRPYAQVIPVAKQQGQLAAANIIRQHNGMPQQPFSYRDRGTMATIGRSKAVAWIYNKVALTGYMAWLMWLGLHLLWLLGFRNRLSVLLGWVWNYLTYDRSVRIILRPAVRDTETENDL